MLHIDINLIAPSLAMMSALPTLGAIFIARRLSPTLFRGRRVDSSIPYSSGRQNLCDRSNLRRHLGNGRRDDVGQRNRHDLHRDPLFDIRGKQSFTILLHSRNEGSVNTFPVELAFGYHSKTLALKGGI